MHFFQQIIFIFLTSVSILFFSKKVRQIRRNIFLGTKEFLNDNKAKRYKNLVLLALGQKKMFRNPLVAFLHFIVYAGFIIINIEITEIVLDGILGTHRLFLKPLGSVYIFIINCFELLAVGVIAGCCIFFVRRNVLKLKRFAGKDLIGFPKRDANLILLSEIVLMGLFLTMNSADTALKLKNGTDFFSVQHFLLSGWIAPVLQHFSFATLIFLERFCWWLHITGIFLFLNYLPYSKHLHIMLAFPNTYYVRLDAEGEMKNMPVVQQEVKYMMQPELAPLASETNTTQKFGAKDVFELSWKNLLDAYSCTECGRCSAACPANQTGKRLSPRKIMMDTRDRLEEVGKNINKNGQWMDDKKTLLGNYISAEELRACTTCNACVEECPVSIRPLDIIIELRRALIMEEGNAPQEWNTMFGNIENNFAPWKFSPEDRAQWSVEV